MVTTVSRTTYAGEFILKIVGFESVTVKKFLVGLGGGNLRSARGST